MCLKNKAVIIFGETGCLLVVWDDTELIFVWIFVFLWLVGGCTPIFPGLFSHCNIPFLIYIYNLSCTILLGTLQWYFLLEGIQPQNLFYLLLLFYFPNPSHNKKTQCGPCPKCCLVSSGGSCNLQSLCQMSSSVADVEGKAGMFCLYWKHYSVLHWSAVLPWPRGAKILRFLS